MLIILSYEKKRNVFRLTTLVARNLTPAFYFLLQMIAGQLIFAFFAGIAISYCCWPLFVTSTPTFKFTTCSITFFPIILRIAVLASRWSSKQYMVMLNMSFWRILVQMCHLESITSLHPTVILRNILEKRTLSLKDTILN